MDAQVPRPFSNVDEAGAEIPHEHVHSYLYDFWNHVDTRL
jgi:hypothetical protein